MLDTTKDSMTCINHTGYCQPDGYGQRKYKGKVQLAHRVAYAEAHGLDVSTMGGVVQHSCDNPGCINPAHLSLGTQQSNTADRTQKDRSAHKVSLADAEYIRACWIKGKGGNTQVLAQRFSVGRTTISLIARSKMRVITSN